MRAPAPAKINLALVVGPTRGDGKHEVVTVLQRVDLADRVAIAPGAALTVAGFPGDTIVRDALAALAAAAGVDPRWTATITKRIPVAAGLGGGSSDAATALRLANETLASPLPVHELRAVAATLGADVPFFLDDGPQLGRGDGSTLEPLDLPQDYWIVLVLPNGAAKESTAAVYAAFDERQRRRRLGRAQGSTRGDARRCPAPARSHRPAAERSRLLAAGRRARTARRLPRRRQRRRPGGLRPLPPSAASGGSPARASPRRHDLADRAGLVRLSGSRGGTVPAWIALPTIEHRSNRFGRRLRESRLRIALIVALVEGILVLVGSIEWWIVVLLAIAAVAFYVMRGRAARREEVRELSWIFAVSQVAVVLVPVLALVLTAFAVVALVVIAVVALVVLLHDRR